MKRGPKSNADLKVIVGDFGRIDDEPPTELTEKQIAIWRSVTASEPKGFFATAVLRGMLADYCRHKESADTVSAIIGSFKPEWLKASDGAARYKELIKMRELETRAATTLATKLRLTNQARYTPQAAATQARNFTQGTRPWEK